jgi:hypothetical protein
MVKILDLSVHVGLRIAGRLEGISRIHPGYIGLRVRYFVVTIRFWKSLISGDHDERMIASHFLAIRAGSERPNLVMPRDQIMQDKVTQWVNPAGFSLPAPGTFGNLQRDFLAGPGIVNLDYSVIKETAIKEQTRLQFRAEFFNLLNHANFALPIASAFVQKPNGGGAPNPTFGKITATTTSSRQIQFALKLLF